MQTEEFLKIQRVDGMKELSLQIKKSRIEHNLKSSQNPFRIQEIKLKLDLVAILMNKETFL